MSDDRDGIGNRNQSSVKQTCEAKHVCRRQQITEGEKGLLQRGDFKKSRAQAGYLGTSTNNRMK